MSTRLLVWLVVIAALVLAIAKDWLNIQLG